MNDGRAMHDGAAALEVQHLADEQAVQHRHDVFGVALEPSPSGQFETQESLLLDDGEARRRQLGADDVRPGGDEGERLGDLRVGTDESVLARQGAADDFGHVRTNPWSRSEIRQSRTMSSGAASSS